MLDTVDKQCESVEWYTPEKILSCVRQYFGGQIPLDPATHKGNPTKAKKFYTKEDDGLIPRWTNGVFLNPPYGSVLPDWTKKIHEEALRGLAIITLLPCGARFSTRYWQRNILCCRLSAICFVSERVAFIDEANRRVNGNIYDSAIYGYNVDVPRFVEVFTSLGKTLKVS